MSPATAARSHAPSSVCGVAAAYDANGNTLSVDNNGTTSGGVKSFIYDGENRPVSITADGVAVSFQYGGVSERIRKAASAKNGVNGIMTNNKHCGAIVCQHVASGAARAYRDHPMAPEDSGWQFLCNSGLPEQAEFAEVWSIERVLMVEPSLETCLDYPPLARLRRDEEDTTWTGQFEMPSSGSTPQ